MGKPDPFENNSNRIFFKPTVLMGYFEISI